MPQPTTPNPGNPRRIISHALLILPSVTLGVLAMIHSGVSPMLWGQQLAAWLLFALLVYPLQRLVRRIPAEIWSVLLLIPLAAALFGEEAGGARRWIDLGVLSVNAALMFLPALLIVLCRAKLPYPFFLCAAVILCAQPSPAQLTAFTAAACPVFFAKKQKLWGFGSFLLLIMLAIQAFRMPVALDPVPYCEGILSMLGGMSQLLQAAGVIALAAVPAFWLLCFFRKRELPVLSLAFYYVCLMLLIFTGEYPVPFMGFSLSPIAGYYFAYAFFSANDENNIHD